MTNEDWKFLLINGKSKRVEVKNPVYSGIKLQSIEGLKPFDKKDAEGNPIVPTAEDAIKIKRETYISFFRKPFKNLLILTGAGASMDVGGPSMAALWGKADEEYKTFETEEIEQVQEEAIAKVEKKVKENGFEIICKSVKHDYAEINLETLLSKIEGTIQFNDDLDIELNKVKVKLSKIR
jgi:hypothetical protein